MGKILNRWIALISGTEGVGNRVHKIRHCKEIGNRVNTIRHCQIQMSENLLLMPNFSDSRLDLAKPAEAI